MWRDYLDSSAELSAGRVKTLAKVTSRKPWSNLGQRGWCPEPDMGTLKERGG